MKYSRVKNFKAPKAMWVLFDLDNADGSETNARKAYIWRFSTKKAAL